MVNRFFLPSQWKPSESDFLMCSLSIARIASATQNWSLLSFCLRPMVLIAPKLPPLLRAKMTSQNAFADGAAKHVSLADAIPSQCLHCVNFATFCLCARVFWCFCKWSLRTRWACALAPKMILQPSRKHALQEICPSFLLKTQEPSSGCCWHKGNAFCHCAKVHLRCGCFTMLQNSFKLSKIVANIDHEPAKGIVLMKQFWLDSILRIVKRLDSISGIGMRWFWYFHTRNKKIKPVIQNVPRAPFKNL